MNKDDSGTGPYGGKEVRPATDGTLVISTWLEYGQVPPGFRARITYGPAGGAERATVSTADPDRVLDIVRQWLQTQTAV